MVVPAGFETSDPRFREASTLSAEPDGPYRGGNTGQTGPAPAITKSVQPQIARRSCRQFKRFESAFDLAWCCTSKEAAARCVCPECLHKRPTTMLPRNVRVGNTPFFVQDGKISCACAAPVQRKAEGSRPYPAWCPEPATSSNRCQRRVPA